MSRTLGVLIGRFQIYHKEHHYLVRQAALENDRLLILIGSRNKRKSIQNPFSAEERQEMIEDAIKADPDLKDCTITFRYLNDYEDNVLWKEQVELVVADQGAFERVSLYGSNKDASSFYLTMFPQYDLLLSQTVPNINATDIREGWLAMSQMIGYKMATSGNVLPATILWLDCKPFDSDLQAEWEYYEKEKEKFKNYPYPETLNFSCGDAVVYCHGKVLMIRRKINPGKGCLALPGGFKNRDETFRQAAIRELYEETGIDIDPGDLDLCEEAQHLFDKPNRSYGVPRSTLAVYFDVSWAYPDGSFPVVKASDDAAEVLWVNPMELYMKREVFDDHSAIVTKVFNKDY